MTQPQPPDWAVQVPWTDVNSPPTNTEITSIDNHAERLADLRGNFVEMILREVVKALRGFFVPDGSTAFLQLENWVGGIPILGDLVEVLTGVEDGNLNDLGTWVNTVFRLGRPLPVVQAATLVDDNPNLIITGDFSDVDSVVAEQGWTWSGAAGRNTVGCAVVTGNGTVQELLSNQIPVVGGQSHLDFSVWVRWDSITYTGTQPIIMGITRYLNGVEVGSEDLAFITSPAATSTPWVELSYFNYAIPVGCDEVRMRFVADASLTGGTVYWDDAVVKKPGLGLMNQIVNGLENLDDNNWGLDDLFAAMLNQFATTSDHGSRITLLENLNSTGNKVNDEFLRTGSTLGSNWNEVYVGAGAGTWGTDGEYAMWDRSGTGTRDMRARYIGTTSTTLTDTQKVLAVLGAKGNVGYLPSIVGFLFICQSHIDLYGRMNTTGTEFQDWIRARFSANGDVTITRSLAGVETDLGQAPGYSKFGNPGGPQPASAGATISLLCGTAQGPRYFEAQINGISVLTVNDSTSAMDSSHRGFGHGCRAEGSILILGQTTPASLNAWAALDN